MTIRTVFRFATLVLGTTAFVPNLDRPKVPLNIRFSSAEAVLGTLFIFIKVNVKVKTPLSMFCLLFF